MSETFQLRSIQPNPFRHIDRYPIQEKKIAALRESLHTTGFWDNVVARIGPDGKPQIAYGHHRLHALREEYTPTKRVSLIIRDLSDDQMLKIMARENLEEWGSSASVEHETVRAVVEAYADGLIELPALPRKIASEQVRYAPGFVQGASSESPRTKPYGVRQVADYLGWQEDKVGYALGALELIDEGSLTESDFDGLGTEAARRVVMEARKAKREREIRAREQRKAAEAARKAAEKAERDRAKAEAERQRRQEQAKAARQEEQRRRHQEEERQARLAAQQAERERKRFERAQAEAEKRADKARQDARKEAARAGKQASAGLKSGKKGHASEDLVDRPNRKGDTAPPDIDDFALKLAARLNKIMDADFDERARELDRLLQFQRYLSPAVAREVDIVLGRIVERIVARRRKLSVDPRTEGIIDAEIVETQEITR